MNDPRPSTPMEMCLRTHLSEPRLATYRHCTDSDSEALELYRWNLLLTGAVFEMLGVVEIALRNAIDRELGAWNSSRRRSNGRRWLQYPASPLFGLLVRQTRGGREISTYDDARRQAVNDSDIRHPGHPRHGAKITHDDVLAHVTFGLWPKLLPHPKFKGVDLSEESERVRRRERARLVMWDEAIHRAFPGQGGKYTVWHWVNRMHGLRNRVAHQEPLVLTDVSSYHRTATRLLRAIEPRIGDWYAGISRVPEVLTMCPVDLSAFHAPPPNRGLSAD